MTRHTRHVRYNKSMFWVTLRRVIKGGWKNFKRNGVVSSAAVLVTAITLSVVTASFLLHALLTSTIATLQDRVDIAIFFSVDAPEDRILNLKSTLEKLPEVATVKYVSADEQVLAFRNRHSDDYLTLQALDELGENPFGGTMVITAKDSTQYEAIANVLEGDTQIARDNAEIIERINFAQNKAVIDRLNRMITAVRQYGFGIIILLSFVSIVIMYTTIRLTLFTMREEIGVMRLVGASNPFIRGPFLVEGILYGFFAWLLTMAIFFLGSYFLSDRIFALTNVDPFSYLLSNFLAVPGLVLLIGVGLGVISSVLAMRRYLSV